MIHPSELISPRSAEWAERIRAEMGNGVQAVIAIGRTLIGCNADVAPGESREALDHAGMSATRAAAFMSIANSPVITCFLPVENLPSGYSVLYELSRLESGELAGASEKGKVRADMTRAEAQRLATQSKSKRATAEKRPHSAPLDLFSPPRQGLRDQGT